MLNKRMFIVILFAIFTSVIFSCGKIDSNKTKPKRGYSAPEFTLKSIDGKEYKLSDYKGKVVFVNYWATWCPPCRKEIPSMVKLYNQLRGEGLEILAISVDTDEKAVKKFIDKYKITFPVLRDKEKKAYNLYKATGVPETHLINKNGIIEASWLGSFNWTHPEIIKKVKELLAQ